MQGSVVAMLDIGKALIPCVRVLGIIHVKDMHNHSIYNLGLVICLGVEGHGFGELGVWDSKMYPDSFKEDLGGGLCCDALLARNQNRHLRKVNNNHKKTVISPLGGWEAQHVVH